MTGAIAIFWITTPALLTQKYKMSFIYIIACIYMKYMFFLWLEQMHSDK